MTNPDEQGPTLREQVMTLLRIRKSAYEQTFGGLGASQTVLKDLARFCRANETTFRGSEREHVLLEGRREVWLRIQGHLNLSSEELYNLTKGN